MNQKARPLRKSKLRSYFRVVFGVLAAAVLYYPGFAPAATEVCDQFSQGLPPRSPTAKSATELLERLEAMNTAERDVAIAAELLSGNIPGFLRRLAPVHLSGKLENGRSLEVTFCALPDYLAIGSDEDYLLVPMRLQTALVVAQEFGLLLPTTKMVDAIYRQASVRLKPQPLPAGPQMRSTDYYWRHNQMVAAQRVRVGLPLGSLTAGDKKDLVLSNRLWRAPGQIAIYGWHRDVERPIQPLSTVHGARYVDYSHGVRLVAPIAYVEGVARSLFDILNDGQLAPLLSDEGALPHLGELLDMLRTKMEKVPSVATEELARVVLPVRPAP